MNRLTFILLGLVAVSAILGLWMTSDPEHAANLAQAQRDAAFSPAMREVVLGILALSIGGYLAWFFLIRKD